MKSMQDCLNYQLTATLSNKNASDLIEETIKNLSGGRRLNELEKGMKNIVINYLQAIIPDLFRANLLCLQY